MKPIILLLHLQPVWHLECNRQEGQGSPHRGNRLQVPDIFSLSLKWQEETNYKCQFFFPFSIQNQEEVSFKILCFLEDTWFHLNLTCLKPWANQRVFLMEMFFLSYVNELCIYPRLCLSSSWFHLRLRTDNNSANQYVLLMQLFS